MEYIFVLNPQIHVLGYYPRQISLQILVLVKNIVQNGIL